MDPSIVPATRRLLVCVVSLLVLAACGGTPTAQDALSPVTELSGGTESTGGPATESFEDPETEDPGTSEEAASGDGGGVQVDLPGLPIGGNATVDESDPTLRCAEINWTGPPDNLPPEVNLEITGIGVSPPDVYEAADGGCTSGLPACQFSPGVLGAPPCGVAVWQVAASPDGGGEIFVSSGSITCEPGHEAICEQFQSELAQNSNPARITWSDGLTDWPSGPDEGESTDGGDTGGEGGTGGTGDEDGTTQAP